MRTLTDEDLAAISAVFAATVRQIVREELALSAAPEKPKATRLSKDWALPKSWGDWAMTEQTSWSADHVRAQAATFKDYWCSKGQQATKTDWLATWRNWVRKAGPMLVHGNEVASAAPVVSPQVEKTREYLASQVMSDEDKRRSDEAMRANRDRLRLVSQAVKRIA